jgi:adenylate kinase family enzyme
MKRVMILGQPGAGKSTLARLMGEKTGLPVFHMDLIHWLPGWVERDKSEKIALAHEVESRDVWIFEGGLSATYDNRLTRADTLIALDFPLWLRAWRVFKRTVRDYGRSRVDLPENCPEQFDPEFWRWIWNTRKINRDRMLAMAETAPAEKQVFILRTPRQVRKFLRTLDGREKTAL